jgi:hypothetical protein
MLHRTLAMAGNHQSMWLYLSPFETLPSWTAQGAWRPCSLNMQVICGGGCEWGWGWCIG